MKTFILIFLSTFTCAILVAQLNLFPIGVDGKWGYVDAIGIIIIEPIFEEVNFFHEELAIVKFTSKYGYINKQGKFKIKPKYSKVNKFYSGISQVQKNEKTYNINKFGIRSLSKYKTPKLESCGISSSMSSENLKYHTFKNKNKFDFIIYFRIIPKNNKSYVHRDSTNLLFDRIIEFNPYAFIIEKNNKYGFAPLGILRDERDFRNTTVIPNKDSILRDIEQKIAPKYDSIKFLKINLGNNYALFEKDNLWGMVNLIGQELIEPKYLRVISNTRSKLLVEFEEGKFGYVSFQGIEYFKRNYY